MKLDPKMLIFLRLEAARRRILEPLIFESLHPVGPSCCPPFFLGFEASGYPLRLVVYLIIYRVCYIPGAGFLPSTVCQKKFVVECAYSCLQTFVERYLKVI